MSARVQAVVLAVAAGVVAVLAFVLAGVLVGDVSPRAGDAAGTATQLPASSGGAVPATQLPASSGAGGFSTTAALCALVGAVAAAGLAAAAAARAQGAARSAARGPGGHWRLASQASPGVAGLAAADPVPAAPTVLSPAATRLDPAAEQLVRAAIEVRDVVPSAALAGRLVEGLAGVGVEEVDPVGQRFDPTTQTAISVVDTDDQTLQGTVAHTERLGYRLHGRIVRPAQVTVYRQAVRST